MWKENDWLWCIVCGWFVLRFVITHSSYTRQVIKTSFGFGAQAFLRWLKQNYNELMINCVRHIARISHESLPRAREIYHTHIHTHADDTSQDEFGIVKSIQIVSAIFLFFLAPTGVLRTICTYVFVFRLLSRREIGKECVQADSHACHPCRNVYEAFEFIRSLVHYCAIRKLTNNNSSSLARRGNGGRHMSCARLLRWMKIQEHYWDWN